jgi:hypothetical protein
MNDAPAAGGDRSWHYALVGALMLAGPIARELYHARYPLPSAEALGLILAPAVVGAALAVAGSRLGRYPGALVFALLLLVFLDLQFDIRRPIVLAAAAVASLAAALWLRRHRAAITCLALGAFYLAALPFRHPDDAIIRRAVAGDSAGDLRPIVHIILDEHLGIGGFRAIGDSTTADFLTGFYLRRGFDVYEGAYSRFNVTRGSIASTLSLGETDWRALLSPDRAGSAAPFLGNPYFARLAGAGYRLHVYQSANLDYCNSSGIPVATCTRIPPTSIANISFLRIPWRQKARLVLRTYLVHSSLLWSLIPGEKDLQSRRVFVTRGLQQLRAAGDEVLSRKSRDDAFFVHLLSPHSPYEVDGECVTYLERQLAPAAFQPTPDSLRKSWKARYRAQVRCTHRVLGQFLDKVEAVYGPGQAIIVIHGDHGSRATHRCEGNVACRPPAATEAAVGQFRPLDFLAEFSTFLAVRGPESRGQVHTEATPLQDFLWAFIKSGFAAVPDTTWPHFIYLNMQWPPPAHPLRPEDMPWAPR